jgi:plastin-1
MGEPSRRAGVVVAAAEKIGVHKSAIPGVRDLVSGNEKLALAFLASLFHVENGLKRYLDARARDSVLNFHKEDDAEVTREERTFRTWMNSLGCQTYCKHLFESLQDGFLLLEIIEKVNPGTVNWKTVNKPPMVSAFKKIENCARVLELAQSGLEVKVVSICGLDLAERKKKATLAIVWQLMRYHSIQMIKSISGDGTPCSEATVLAWANRQVEASGANIRLARLNDKSVSDCRFLLALLQAVAPKMVDPECIRTGGDAEDKKLNAKYVISLARKLGCVIFLSWDDIMEARQKMLFSLLAAIMAAVQQRDSIM